MYCYFCTSFLYLYSIESCKFVVKKAMEKYINLFTDFGFKKLFGEEQNIDEIANYNPKERKQYEESLKYYRDYENSMDLKFEKGKAEGEMEKALEIAKSMKKEGFEDEVIAKLTGISIEEIARIN